MIALAAQHKNSDRQSAPQTNFGPGPFDSLLLDFCNYGSVLSVRRFELPDSKATHDRIESFSEPSVHLALDKSLVGTIEDLTAHIFCPWRSSKLDGHRLTGPIVRLRGFDSRPFHLAIDPDFTDAPDNADSTSDSEGNDGDNYNNNQKSKHPATLLREAGIK